MSDDFEEYTPEAEHSWEERLRTRRPSNQPSLDEIRRDLYNTLEKKISNRNDVNKRFFRYGLARDLLYKERLKTLFRALYDLHDNLEDKERLRRLVQHTRGRPHSTTSGRCNILAILIYSRCTNQDLQKFEGIFIPAEDAPQDNPSESRNIDVANGEDKKKDADLPFDEETCVSLLAKEAGRLFYKTQFQFCPVVLKKTERGIYTGHRAQCPLPFLKSDVLGEGSFGKVYKVKIEKKQFYKEDDTSANQKAIFLARKVFDFADRSSFTRELDTIEKIISNITQHNGIMETLAILVHGDSYSLFSNVARCDLSVFLNDKTEPVPRTLLEKKRIFHGIVEIAKGLKHLHEDLEDGDFKTLRCYHLDLKPQNILIFVDKDGRQRWQISDFGISKVKPVVRKTREGDVIDFDSLFRRRHPVGATSASGTIDHRFAGTYGPPEAMSRESKLGRSSDWWSFACVMSTVMSFLDNGATGVKNFADFRVHGPGGGKNEQQSRKDDKFFNYDSGQLAEASVNDYVLEWFQILKKNASGKGDEEDIVNRTLSLFEDYMLLPNQDERRKKATSTEMEQALIDIFQTFPEDEDTQNIQTNGAQNGTTEVRAEGTVFKEGEQRKGDGPGRNSPSFEESADSLDNKAAKGPEAGQSGTDTAAREGATNAKRKRQANATGPRKQLRVSPEASENDLRRHSAPEKLAG